MTPPPPPQNSQDATRRQRRTILLAAIAGAALALAGVLIGLALAGGFPRPGEASAPPAMPSTEPPQASAEPGSPTAAPPASSPAAPPTTAAPPARHWPTIQGEPGGSLLVDGRPVGREPRSGSPTQDFLALMGTPDEKRDLATCLDNPLQHTTYRWGDLRVVVLNEEDTTNPYGFAYPPGEVAGWIIDPTLDGQPGLSFPMTGPEGAKIGDTVTTLEALFPPDQWDYADREGNVFTIFAGDISGAAFDLDADDQVRRMWAGYACA